MRKKRLKIFHIIKNDDKGKRKMNANVEMHFGIIIYATEDEEVILKTHLMLFIFKKNSTKIINESQL